VDHAASPVPDPARLRSVPVMQDAHRRYVAEIARLFESAGALPTEPPSVGGINVSRDTSTALTALVMAPHPDDECVMGALPLRLARNAGYGIHAVAVTLGSREDRRRARVAEMEAACAVLGFGLEVLPGAGGGGLRMEERESDRARWNERVKDVTGVLERHRPRVVFVPHERDSHGAHVATRELLLEALAGMGETGRSCWVVETEFWGQMDDPNLLVGSSVEEAGDLVAALAQHVGEVARNPYHLRLPAWMMDNVRRGAEKLGGHGSAAPDLVFGTLYRVNRWRDGELRPVREPRVLGLGDDPAVLFGDLETPP
jgi:N-acetylglucosamine malate deacetylase 1